MKPGDLVRRSDGVDYNYGVGLVIKRLVENPFLVHPDDPTGDCGVGRCGGLPRSARPVG